MTGEGTGGEAGPKKDENSEEPPRAVDVIETQYEDDFPGEEAEECRGFGVVFLVVGEALALLDDGAADAEYSNGEQECDRKLKVREEGDEFFAEVAFGGEHEGA